MGPPKSASIHGFIPPDFHNQLGVDLDGNPIVRFEFVKKTVFSAYYEIVYQFSSTSDLRFIPEHGSPAPIGYRNPGCRNRRCQRKSHACDVINARWRPTSALPIHIDIGAGPSRTTTEQVGRQY